MADQRLTTRPDKAVAEDTDIIYIVRPSDTSADASGTGFKMNRSAFRTDLEDLGIKHVQTIAEFNSLVTGATAGKWLISSDISLTASKTLPTGVELSFNNSTLDLNGFTLTGTKTKIDAGLTQIFNLNGGLFAGSFELKETYPEWFGAKGGDDTVDDSVAFNENTDFLNNIGGGKIKLSSSYYIDSRRSGDSWGVEVFSNTSIYGDASAIVKVGDNLGNDTPLFLTNSASNVRFNGFEINGNKQRLGTPGVGEDEGIDIKGGGNIWITNMYIHDMGMDGIDTDRVSNVGDNVIIDNCIIDSCGGVGIHNNFYATLVTNCIITNNGHERYANQTGQVQLDACGVDFKGNDGKVSNCYIADNVRGVNISGINNSVLSNNSIIDNTLEGVVVSSVLASSLSTNTIISSNVIKGNLYGIWVKGSDGTLELTSNIVSSQGASNIGLKIEDTNGFVISGGSYLGVFGIEIDQLSGITKISTELKGSSNGVRVNSGVVGTWLEISNCLDNISTGAGAIDLRGLVSGVKILNNNFINRVGIRMLNSGGNPSNTIIKDNQTTGMTILGTGHVIERNSGYITENYGAGTIIDTATTDVITHGLSITPTFINVTGDNDEHIWYSTITSTEFTVNRTASSGALNFSWEGK